MHKNGKISLLASVMVLSIQKFYWTDMYARAPCFSGEFIIVFVSLSPAVKTTVFVFS